MLYICRHFFQVSSVQAASLQLTCSENVRNINHTDLHIFNTVNMIKAMCANIV